MKFVCEKEITASVVLFSHYMPRIDIDDNSTKKLVQKIGDNGKDEELIKVLNVLGQDIQQINTMDYSYVHMNTKLQFSELSRGEKVFLVSYAAMVANEDIYLQYDMMQLTKTSLRKYYELFENCEYINIIYDTTSTHNYLKYAMQGVI